MDGTGPGESRRGRFAGARSLLEDDVCIGATDAERRHRGSAWPCSRLPELGFRRDVHGAGRPVDGRGGHVGVQRGRNKVVAQGEDHLHDAAHTGRRLRMSDVRLQRPQQHPAAFPPAVGRQHRLGLDRIAEPSARPVTLHHVHVVDRKARDRQRLPDHPLLGQAVGRRQPVRRAVRVHRRAAHDGEHPAPGAARVRQPLEHDDAHALGESRPVGVLGERTAPAVG